MDIFHIDLLYKLYCLFEKTKNRRKRGRGWSIFNKKSIYKIDRCNEGMTVSVLKSSDRHEMRTIKEVAGGQKLKRLKIVLQVL